MPAELNLKLRVDEPFKSKKYLNVQSKFKEDTEQRVLSRRNTYEGFKNAAI